MCKKCLRIQLLYKFFAAEFAALKKNVSLALLCLCSTFSLHGGTFRALILADSASNLSIPAKKDVLYLKEAFSTICLQTGLELSLDIIDEHELTHQNVASALMAPNNNGADVLFFYYTGHGFHPSKIDSPWPTIMLSLTHEALDTKRICAQLSGYQARLTVIFLDCCNSTSNRDVFLKDFSTNSHSSNRCRNLKKLFLGNSGTIIATASQVGSPAYAFSEGSLFTVSFIKTVFNDQTNCTCWTDIFERISLQCQPFQTPYVFFDLHEEEYTQTSSNDRALRTATTAL
jgi:hypothetical protein